MHGWWIDGLDWFPEHFPLIIFCFLEFFLKPTLFFSSSIYFQLGECKLFHFLWRRFKPMVEVSKYFCSHIHRWLNVRKNNSKGQILPFYQNYRIYKKELFIFSKMCAWIDLVTYCSIQGSRLINTNWYGKIRIENMWYIYFVEWYIIYIFKCY